MLKENIRYGVEGKFRASTDDIKDLIKEYMLLGIKYKKEKFDYIEYRNHKLYINDKGYKDAFTLEKEIRDQVKEVNDIEDGE